MAKKRRLKLLPTITFLDELWKFQSSQITQVGIITTPPTMTTMLLLLCERLGGSFQHFLLALLFNFHTFSQDFPHGFMSSHIRLRKSFPNSRVFQVIGFVVVLRYLKTLNRRWWESLKIVWFFFLLLHQSNERWMMNNWWDEDSLLMANSLIGKSKD